MHSYRLPDINSEKLPSFSTDLLSVTDTIRSVLEGIPHGVVIWDEAFNLVECNSAHLDLYGIQPSDAVPGTPMRRFLECASNLVIRPR
jgi:PAS domain-containing protein